MNAYCFAVKPWSNGISFELFQGRNDNFGGPEQNFKLGSQPLPNVYSFLSLWCFSGPSEAWSTEKIASFAPPRAAPLAFPIFTSVRIHPTHMAELKWVRESIPRYPMLILSPSLILILLLIRFKNGFQLM